MSQKVSFENFLLVLFTGDNYRGISPEIEATKVNKVSFPRSWTPTARREYSQSDTEMQ